MKFSRFKIQFITLSISNLVNRMKSKKRSIISPRPIAAALIQASYDTSRPLSARRMKNRGKNLFSAKLSEQIDERLPFCRNNLEIHQVYREAFQSIIEKYSNYSQSMNMLKYGYEDLIDTFVNEIKENEQKNEQIEKSQTDFKNLLHLQEKEMDDKKLYYDNLSIQVEEQIQRMFLFGIIHSIFSILFLMIDDLFFFSIYEI